MTARLHGLLGLGLGLLVVACGDGDDDDSPGGTDAGSGDAGTASGDAGTRSDSQLATDTTAKLMQCNAYDGPPRDPSDEKIEDEFDRCAARCVIEASCASLTEFLCSEQEPSASNPALLCFKKCPQHPSDGYACSNGTKIPKSSQCDGFADCEDGADENGCGTYRCKDGEEIDDTHVECDGFDDCIDASDESGCPAACSG